MPRAKLPERLAARQVPQLVAVSKRLADGAAKSLQVEIDTVSAAVPPDLSAAVANLDARVSALEP